MLKRIIFVITLLSVFAIGSLAHEHGDTFVFGDALPDAPELAARGEYAIGVQTMTFTNPDQINILSTGEDDAIYDREITVEIWYPADVADDDPQLVEYDENLGRADQEGTLRPFTFLGRATRDAQPAATDDAYPLIIVSHGYPGSRYQLSYLTENLASKGYVVVAIGHTESTFEDVGAFGSTLYHRPLDQEFILEQMAQLSAGDGAFSGLIDADNTAIIGYSMGGYGALNTIGAGYSAVLSNFFGEAAAVVEPRLESNEDYLDSLDSRIKAAVVFAPWGNDLTAAGAPGVSLWTPEAFANISVPTLWIAGSEDDIAIYDSIVNMFDSAINSERYFLTYLGALHNSAPNPPPAEATELVDYERYADPVWEEKRINNINQHFITAFLGHYIKGNEDYAAYLDLGVEFAADGVYAVDEEGNFTEDHTYWTGFLPRTASGMTFVAGAPE